MNFDAPFKITNDKSSFETLKSQVEAHPVNFTKTYSTIFDLEKEHYSKSAYYTLDDKEIRLAIYELHDIKDAALILNLLINSYKETHYCGTFAFGNCIAFGTVVLEEGKDNLDKEILLDEIMSQIYGEE